MSAKVVHLDQLPLGTIVRWESIERFPHFLLEAGAGVVVDLMYRTAKGEGPVVGVFVLPLEVEHRLHIFEEWGQYEEPYEDQALAYCVQVMEETIEFEGLTIAGGVA